MAGEWSFYLHHTPLNTTVGTGQRADMTQATGRSMSFSRTEGATLTFTLPGSHQDTALYQIGTTDILAYRLGRCMQRFRITSYSFGWDENGAVLVTFTAKSYRLLLDAWIIHDDSTRDFTAVEQTAIGWTLISEAEAQPNEEWNLSRGTLPGVPVLRDRIATGTDSAHGYDAGAKVGEMVENLSRVDGGFEHDVEPDPDHPNTHLVWNTWNIGERKQHDGYVSDFVLDVGGTVSTFDRVGDMGEFANVIRMQGREPTGENTDGAVGAVVWRDESADSPYGRIERNLSSDAVTQDAVEEAAEAEIQRLLALEPFWEITLDAGRWSPDALWLGDYARFVGDVAYLGSLDVVKRAEAFKIDLSDEGVEVVKLSLGRPRADYFTRLVELKRRIAKLERK